MKQPPNEHAGDAERQDEEIIRRVLGGEVDAFEDLIVRYESFAVRIVVTKVPRADLEEVVHDVFIRAFKSLPGFKGTSPFRHWLSRIAVRACYDYWRGQYQNREDPVSALSERQESFLENLALNQADGPNDQAAVDQFEARELLDWAFGYLSAGDRLAISLTYLEGYSVAEAAELLGWSSANIKVRCYRGKRKLRQIISKTMEMRT
ncbi:MAG: RNA polymerase sigma factor [Proteobacteria bacterium]|nr:RNA polymerase sigma factor [Pseudomonadota bacterium]